ncbi:MAG: hypothetical protein JNN15_17275 [Blastocatellia bacterium]|nr:hypothetical protein [Blastocatellia bacterium]
MKKLSALLLAIPLALFITIANTTKAFGQAGGGQQAAQGQVDERKAYSALTACNDEKDFAKKLQMAKEALALYPGSQYIPYFKQQVDVARGGLLQQAQKDDKPDEVFKIGDEILADDPENLNVLLLLSQITWEQARKKNYSLAAQGANKYTTKSLELIGANKKPASIDDAQWGQRRPVVLGILHQTKGMILLNDKKTDEALNELGESVKNNCAEPYTYLLIFPVYQEKYNTISEEYNKLSDDEKVGENGKAALAKVDAAADELIAAYAKFIAFSEGKQGYENIRGKVQPLLNDLYKYRNKDNPDGVKAYIDNIKSGCK